MSYATTRLLLVGVAGVLVATTVAVLAVRQAEPDQAASGSTPSTIPVPAPVAATQLASDGVRANWVIQENQSIGTTGWQITNAPAKGFIDGFADQTYATVGQPVHLYVSTSAPSWHVEAYRMGYYGGAGGRLVWSSPDYPGQVQPPCPLTAGVNMVSCDNWTSALTVQITQYFAQGDYLLKLVGSGNEQSYVPLTVWDPSSHAAYLVKDDVFTWQAWNTYGGYDYYAGQGTCPANVYPLCSRARIVSFDRPYAGGDGAGDFLTLELPLIRFVEQHGLDVTYVNDMLVQDRPDVLNGHRALLSLGHDECWSNAERTAVTAANAKGLNLAFFGASAILRHVRTQASPLGPDRELVDYRDPTEDPLTGKGDPADVTSNTWGSPPASEPESGLVGSTYNGFLDPGVLAPMTIVDQSAWIFNGTGLTNGTSLANVIGSDVDSLEPTDEPYPSDVEVFAHSSLPAGQAQTISQNGSVFYSDMTYYTNSRTNAGVWDSGTNNWIPALTNGQVQQMTTNVLWLFGQGPAGKLRPSVPNAKVVY